MICINLSVRGDAENARFRESLRLHQFAHSFTQTVSDDPDQGFEYLYLHLRIDLHQRQISMCRTASDDLKMSRVLKSPES